MLKTLTEKQKTNWKESLNKLTFANLTPRGGTGKLRNHWEDVVHTVVRQVGEGSPIYEVKPEQGKGRSRVLHRNLLLSCDYLPLEVELRKESKTKKTVNEQRLADENESSPEEGEDEDYYCYLPAVQHQQPVEENNELDNPYLPVVQPSEPEKEKREVNLEIMNADETTAQTENEDLPQQEGDAMNEEQPVEPPDDVADASAAPDESNSEGEQGYRWPRRERRPPKTFTYDYLGTPACYSAQHPNTMSFHPTPYEMQTLIPWTYPESQYQPVYLYAY
ncbi:hypothetical protein DPX16_22629 [Anabarilius grahami]|uniref:Uncharacterized protein n=1 Tax=Anabarilius grahami TaxID=495550 RepID=A0A3N0XH02_ANAGA|nr:hypothetical protein DPX16_22629 [Anabarilius grahami]